MEIKLIYIEIEEPSPVAAPGRMFCSLYRESWVQYSKEDLAHDLHVGNTASIRQATANEKMWLYAALSEK